MKVNICKVKVTFKADYSLFHRFRSKKANYLVKLHFKGWGKCVYTSQFVKLQYDFLPHGRAYK